MIENFFSRRAKILLEGFILSSLLLSTQIYAQGNLFKVRVSVKYVVDSLGLRQDCSSFIIPGTCFYDDNCEIEGAMLEANKVLDRLGANWRIQLPAEIANIQIIENQNGTECGQAPGTACWQELSNFSDPEATFRP